MQIFLFSIVAICIAGSRTQELAIGTEYLRAHINDSLSSESAINAQSAGSSTAGIILINPASSASSTDLTTTTAASKDDDDSPEDNGNTNKKHPHEHHSHHDHAATISIDVHHILDLFKLELHATEERILAAIQHDHPSSPAPVLKSYRTADR